MLKVKLEYPLFLNRHMEIVAVVQQKALADDGGNVILPAGYRELSSDGELYVYRNDKNGIVVGFWVFRGLLMNPYTSVIYTSDDAPPTAQNLDCSRIYNATRLGANWYYVKAY